MTPEDRERVWAVFDEAVELPAGEREAFLNAACKEDVRLRAEVESLLAHDFTRSLGEADFLKSPVVRGLEALVPPKHPYSAAASSPPQRIGRYRILRELGSGGMGTVYEAEQDNPRRPVALKVVRAGIVSLGLVKRFVHEAQILGRLHHSGIAQIYEAGLTEEHQPYFAMELIRGTSLDRHVRDRSLDVRARLELFAKVCDAVQHAHDRGVIHRDLKPANILVDETGQAKVLDFGVARATDADLQTTGRTEVGELIGTLSYMSPEQIAADPALIDQRSDVYSLGVVLFDLLADRLPYQLAGIPLPVAARVIQDRDPAALGSIKPLLRGDVETIVAKAMEKDRTRRYASAGALASDLRCYLNHEPIRARPASARYRMRKFAQRHKALVGGVAGIVAALVLGLLGTILFALETARSARIAREAEKEARFQTYRARIAAAGAALNLHDVVNAARQLEEAPDELRGWEWYHLNSRLDDSALMMQWPGGATEFLSGAPHTLEAGTLTAGAWRLTNLETGEERTEPTQASRGSILQVARTRRGLRVASFVAEEMTINVLDEAGNFLCRTAAMEPDLSRKLVLSPDGARMVSFRKSSSDLSIYDVASGKLTTCEGHHKEILTVAFSSDGTRLASAGEDETAILWDPVEGKLLATCKGHTSKVVAVAFNPDGTRLVTTSSDGTVRQWDAATGGEAAAPYDHHTGEVIVATYSPDGEWIASGGTDRTIRIWRAKDRQDVAVLHGHKGAVGRLVFAQSGHRLASGSDTSTLWRGDGTVRVWDIDPRATLPVLHGHTSYVYPVAWSPDGQWIASGSWDQTVRLWDAATGELCASYHHPGNVRSLAFGPDSNWLVSTSSEEERLYVWDIATGRCRKRLAGPGPLVQAMALSPDGKQVAMCEREAQTVSITDLATGRRIASISAELAWPPRNALAYSPDGRWLAGTGRDLSVIEIWNTQTYQQSARLAGHTEFVYVVAFSPDGRLLASGGRDHSVRIWDVATGECRAVLRGHSDEVLGLAFHPDGKRLASAGRDRVIWMWDLEKNQEVARLAGHTTYVFSLAFSPDGNSLVSGSGDGTVRLWDTEPLSHRFQARREAEILRPQAEELVKGLLQKKKDAAEVFAALQSDSSLSDSQRHAALRAVVR